MINEQSFAQVEAAKKVDTMATTYLKMLGRDIVSTFRWKKLGDLFKILCSDHPRYKDLIGKSHDAEADSVCLLLLISNVFRICAA
jgi:hypothetical protein